MKILSEVTSFQMTPKQNLEAVYAESKVCIIILC